MVGFPKFGHTLQYMYNVLPTVVGTNHYSEHSGHQCTMNDSITVTFSVQFYHNYVLELNWSNGNVCYITICYITSQ